MRRIVIYKKKPVVHSPPVDTRMSSLSELEKIDFLHFWSHQMKEHCLFLHLLISGESNVSYQDRSYELFIEWSNFIQKIFSYVQDDKVFLNETDFKLIDMKFSDVKDELLIMLMTLKSFKTAILDDLKSGKWLGMIIPSLVEHFLLELNHVIDYLYNPVAFSTDWSVERLSSAHNNINHVEFWNTVSGGHAGYLSKLVDLSETSTSKELEDFFTIFFADITGYKDFYEESRKNIERFCEFTKNMMKKIELCGLKSCINKILMHHIIRENERALGSLNKK